jgi:MFS family permease
MRIFVAVIRQGIGVGIAFGPKSRKALGLSSLNTAGVIGIESWLMILPGALRGLIAGRFGRRDTILTVRMTPAVAALLLPGVPKSGLGASLLFGLVGMAPAGVVMALFATVIPSALLFRYFKSVGTTGISEAVRRCKSCSASCPSASMLDTWLFKRDRRHDPARLLADGDVDGG